MWSVLLVGLWPLPGRALATALVGWGALATSRVGAQATNIVGALATGRVGALATDRVEVLDTCRVGTLATRREEPLASVCSLVECTAHGALDWWPVW